MPYVYPFAGESDRGVDMVWAKGVVIQNYPPAVWRRDVWGHAIARAHHGRTDVETGWEIDHIWPASRGGGNDLKNLQPLCWSCNREKGDSTSWQGPGT